MIREIVSKMMLRLEPPKFSHWGLLNGIPQESQAQTITERLLCSQCG